MKTTYYSACPLNCFDGCSMIVARTGEGDFKLSGHAEHPITRGKLCGKGYALKRRHEHPERLLYPLKKIDGAFHRISWEKALYEIAEHIARAYQEKGPTSLFFSYDYASSGLLTALEARLWNRLGGMSETVSTLCWSAGIAAQKADMGASRTNAPDTLLHARHIIVWGRNVTTTNMHLLPFLQEAQAQGARLAVVDPYPQKLIKRSDLYVPIRAGGDYAAILYIMQKIIQHDQIDRDFIDHHTIGFDALRRVVLAYEADELLREAGVPQEQLDELYTYVVHGPTRVIAGYGLQRYAHGGLTIRLLDALMAMTGQLGRLGAGIDYAHTVLGSTVRTDRLTLSEKRYAYRPVIRARQADILPTLKDPPLEVLYVTRANPLAQAPQRSRLKQAYENIPVKIVVEQFLTETAAVADYVLPAATVFEQSDIYYSSMWHGYIQYAEQIVPPRGEARPEWEIVRDLATLLGVGEDFQYTPSDYWKMALGHVMDDSAFKQLFRDGYFLLTPEKTAWEQKTFLTDDGKFHFVTSLPETIDIARAKRPPVTVRLITIHPHQSLHSQHRRLFGSHPAVRMSPLLAEQLGLYAGDWVRLSNDGGRFEGRLVYEEAMRDDIIVVEEGISDGVHFINDLTPTALSDLGEGSTQYETFVKIEKINEPKNLPAFASTMLDG